MMRLSDAARAWSPLCVCLFVACMREIAAARTNATTSNTTGVDVDLLFGTPEGDRGLDDLQLAPLVAACVALFFGAVLCLAGARVLRSAALGCAFFDGAFGTAVVLEKLWQHAEWEGVVSWTCFFLGGIFCCLLVVSVHDADVVCVGLTAGLLTACTCLTTFGYHIAPSHPELVLYVLLGVLGVGSGLLTLKTQPVSVLPATSWIGSNMATWGIGYFFGDYPNATTIKKFRRASDGEYELPSAWWGYLGAAMVCFLVGTCVQAHTFRFTRKRLRTARPFDAASVRRALEDGDLEEDGDHERDTQARCHYTAAQTPSSREPQTARSAPRPMSRGSSIV